MTSDIVDFPKLVTGQQMAAIDRVAIEDCGALSLELMERAGVEVVEVIRNRWDGLEDLSVSILCGKGNNGGDGLVIARLLKDAGVTVDVYLTSGSALSADAATNLDRLRSFGVSAQPFPGDVEEGAQLLRSTDLVVDAMLGIGAKGAVRGELANVVAAIVESHRPVLSVDVPTGVDADDGVVRGPCVDAAVTVTFGLAKVGQLFFPGRSYCGDLELVDIGFPPESIDSAEIATRLISSEVVAGFIPSRAPDAHKGSCGAVAIVGASVGMTGAAALTAETALWAGAGRVTLGVPASLNDILEVKLTEVMTRPLPEVRSRRCLSLRALGEIEVMLESADCLALGPGLGIYRETSELVRRLLLRQLEEDNPLPVVVDADGLNALVGSTDTLMTHGREELQLVLTPHVGEFSRLTQIASTEIAAHPLEHAGRFATETGCVLVLKGAPTIVALPDGTLLVNPAGNAGMATAGSGDVLTGVIASLLAQGLPANYAASAGVYLHSLAGDLAQAEKGIWGVVAGDISRNIPKALTETAGHAVLTPLRP